MPCLIPAIENNTGQLPRRAGHVCGLKRVRSVEKAFEDIVKQAELRWGTIREQPREAGRYHVETYRGARS